MFPAGYLSDEDSDDLDYFSSDVRVSLERPAPIDLIEEKKSRIYAACIHNKLDEVKSILADGFEIDTIIRDKWTLLLTSSACGASGIAIESIKFGANVNYQTDDGMTPLMLACSCPKQTASFEDSHKIVKALLDGGADFKITDRRRMNALMHAASSGNVLIVNELLKFGNEHAEDNQGWTALYWAVYANKVQVVSVLLEVGMKCDGFDIRGDTLIDIAKKNDRIDILNLLPNNKKEDLSLEGYISNQCYDTFFSNGNTDFIVDRDTMLFGMQAERFIDKFNINFITLFELLTIEEDGLISIGIEMPYARYRILNGVHKFHKRPYNKLLKKSEYNKLDTVKIANALLIICRQLVCMRASIKFINNSIYNVNELREFDNELKSIMLRLNSIKYISDKSLLDRVHNWDQEIKPCDLITKESERKLKVKTKLYYKIGFVSLILVFTLYKMKKYA